MRRTSYPFVVALFIMTCGLAGGCAQIPPCTVSPIEIEETREDVKVLEKDLVAARDRAKKLSDNPRLQAGRTGQQEGRSPPKLRKKLKELKKGSGRETEDDKKKEDDKDDDKEST